MGGYGGEAWMAGNAMALPPCCATNAHPPAMKLPPSPSKALHGGCKRKPSPCLHHPLRAGLPRRSGRRESRFPAAGSAPSLHGNGQAELPPPHPASQLGQSTILAGDKWKGRLHLVGVVASFIIVGLLLAIAAIVVSGGQTALVEATAKSGFPAAFSLIFVSEIGDKTFFIAALLAMQHSRTLVLLGSCGALALMTIISVAIGRIFHAIPVQLRTTIPIGQYAAVALLSFFGFKSIKHAWGLPSASLKVLNEEITEMGELIEAEEFVKKAEGKKTSTPIEILGKVFSLIFLAEWGDRSMLATIALGAAQSPLGVTLGAIVGHVIATGMAVIGGAFLTHYISEKLVSYMGGCLFLAFAAATLMGAF